MDLQVSGLRRNYTAGQNPFTIAFCNRFKNGWQSGNPRPV